MGVELKEIIFLGAKSIGYYCMEFLLENSHQLNIRVCGAITGRKTGTGEKHDIEQLCKQYNIPVIKSLEKLEEYNPVDFLISVQYNRILKKQHIAKAKELAVNLHMAPLPEYRGCNQFSYAIIDGKKEFGTTLHVLDESIDGGDILFERRFPIPEDAYARDLFKKTDEVSLTLFKECIPLLLQGKYKRTPQQLLVADRGTSLHFRNEIEKLKQIDLSWTPEKIQRHIRATEFPPFDPPYTIINGMKRTVSLNDEGQYQLSK